MNRYKLSKAGVDVEQGLNRVGYSKEFYESLLKKFCEDDYYEQLKSALKQEECQEAFRYAHTLKGISGNLSMTRLYNAIAPLVEELRKGNLANAQALFPEVEAAYEVLMDVLKNM